MQGEDSIELSVSQESESTPAAVTTGSGTRDLDGKSELEIKLQSAKPADDSADSHRKPFETVLSRVLRRSSEFSVGSIRLSVSEQLACLAIVATSFCWFWLFIQQQISMEALPWCSVLMFTAIISLARYLSRRQASIFELLNLAGKSPVTFGQSFAFSYVAFSAVIWVCLGVFHNVHLKDNNIARRQVVEIELVSDKDFADHKDILPGTVEKPSLKAHKNEAEFTQRSPTPISHQLPSASSKREANSVAGAVQVSKVQQRTREEKNLTATQPRPANDRQTEKYIINVAESPRPVHASPTVMASAGENKSRSRQPVLEEVAPPEMVEITESQGDNGNDTFQPGGRSTGGTGKKTPLVGYLKELHRRIKHAWTPPAGEQRSAEILFRIRKNGTLASIKLVTSSGESDADESAMHAIASCSPFKPLPADYPAGYLDLLYTFNYNVDELSEVGAH